MSKIKYIILIFVGILIYSCTEDFETPPTPPDYNNIAPVLVDTVDNSLSVLYKQSENLSWDTLAWIPAKMYEGQGLVTHYSVQIDQQGNNFASMFEIQGTVSSDTSIIITIGKLNSELLANDYDPVVTYDLELRIKAFVHNDLETLYSEVYEFSVTTYKDIPVPSALYLFGDATAVGWGADTSLIMLKDGGKFIKFAYLENNKKFRFLKAQNTTDNTYNSESLINMPQSVSEADDADKNFLFTGETGWYRIEADYLTSTLSISEYTFGSYTYTYDYSNLYLVGDYNAADGAWDANNAKVFTKVSEGVFTIIKQLKNDAYIKFLGQQSWGDLDWGSIKEEGNSGILGPKGYNGNIKFNGGDKTYEIKVDLKQGIYTFTEIETLPPVIYLVGSLNGWDNNGLYIAARGDNVHVAYQYLDATTYFKILVQRGSWDDSWGAGATAGTIAKGGGDISASGLPTYTSAGFYEIKFDLFNETVTLTPVSMGVIGDAQSGGWNTDVNLTYNTTSKKWEGQVTFLATGNYKFRANDGWDINFGGSLDNLVHGGSDMPTPGAGNYNISLDLSGTTKFSATVNAAK